MKYLSIIAVSVPYILCVTPAQQTHYTTSNKKAIKLYTIARKFIDAQEYDKSIGRLQEAVKIDDHFLEAYNQLADLLKKQHHYESASIAYRKILGMNPKFNYTIYFNLGTIEIALGDYQNAQKHLRDYLHYDNNISTQKKAYVLKLIKDCVFSIEAVKHPVSFQLTNMGAAINTANDEYLPVQTADGKTLLFTRRIGNNEDFYQSNFKHEQWQQATHLSGQVNTTYNEGAQSITQDGKSLFFTGCNRSDGFGRCDIYMASKKHKEWQKPVNIGPPICTPAWESQPAISGDERTLYFVSNRKEGYGGYDIWKSTLLDEGVWSEPENLGPNINTPYDEQSPFLHPDDRTLYFSSNGWPGMGGNDIFVSRQTQNGQWTKPENLGYPINTSRDENGLTVTANGLYAFFSSNSKLNSFGGYDIYTFPLHKQVQPKKVTYVKGVIKDAHSGKKIPATVQVVDLKTGKIVYNMYSDGGNFLVPLLFEEANYALTISKDGYLFYSENIVPEMRLDRQAFFTQVHLQPINIGKKTVLSNVFFASNHADWQPESKAELDKLLVFLHSNPKVLIEIAGHTDDTGDELSNQILSENRAKNIYNYLINNSIDSNRLQYKGYGTSQPIASNASEDGRKKNRRTEFKVIGK